jgi:hypothetical protein
MVSRRERFFMEVIYLLFIVCFACLVIFMTLFKPLIDEEREAKKMIKDYRELFLQTKQSAENENIKDMYFLSSFYQEGIGVRQNIEKAFYWYKVAKEKEYVELDKELEKFIGNIIVGADPVLCRATSFTKCSGTSFTLFVPDKLPFGLSPLGLSQHNFPPFPVFLFSSR